jgi:hypothetical protein
MKRLNSELICPGQGGYHQPIQLPELKIPMTEEVSDHEEKKPTIPPPELPTYYNYQPPKYYAGFYNPTIPTSRPINPYSYSADASPSPGRNDYVGYPWPQGPSQNPEYVQNHPSGLYNHHQRIPPHDSPRGLQSQPTLLDKIAGFLG